MGNIKKNFSAKEIQFLQYYMEDYIPANAYAKTHPNTNGEKKNLQKLASKFLIRLRKKAGSDANFLEFLEASNLGNFRFVEELNQRFKAVKYRTRPVRKIKSDDEGREIEYTELEEKEEPDEVVRMKATDLLADILGKKKQTIVHEDNTENPLVDAIDKLTEAYNNNEPEQEAD